MLTGGGEEAQVDGGAGVMERGCAILQGIWTAPGDGVLVPLPRTDPVRSGKRLASSCCQPP